MVESSTSSSSSLSAGDKLETPSLFPSPPSSLPFHTPGRKKRQRSKREAIHFYSSNYGKTAVAAFPFFSFLGRGCGRERKAESERPLSVFLMRASRRRLFFGRKHSVSTCAWEGRSKKATPAPLSLGGGWRRGGGGGLEVERSCAVYHTVFSQTFQHLFCRRRRRALFPGKRRAEKKPRNAIRSTAERGKQTVQLFFPPKTAVDRRHPQTTRAATRYFFFFSSYRGGKVQWVRRSLAHFSIFIIEV